MQAINCCIPGSKLTSLFKLFFFDRSSCNWLKHYLCKVLYYAGFCIEVSTYLSQKQEDEDSSGQQYDEHHSHQNGVLKQKDRTEQWHKERQNGVLKQKDRTEHWYKERQNGVLKQKDRTEHWYKERQNGELKQKDRTGYWNRKTEHVTDTLNDIIAARVNTISLKHSLWKKGRVFVEQTRISIQQKTKNNKQTKQNITTKKNSTQKANVWLGCWIVFFTWYVLRPLTRASTILLSLAAPTHPHSEMTAMAAPPAMAT